MIIKKLDRRQRAGVALLTLPFIVLFVIEVWDIGWASAFATFGFVASVAVALAVGAKLVAGGRG